MSPLKCPIGKNTKQIMKTFTLSFTEEMVTREATVDAPFSALAFKIATDPFVGRLCFFRVYSGT